jgi:hypothetical protein
MELDQLADLALHSTAMHKQDVGLLRAKAEALGNPAMNPA